MLTFLFSFPCKEYLFRMVPRSLEPGKGKCPYDPRQHSMAVLVSKWP